MYCGKSENSRSAAAMELKINVEILLRKTYTRCESEIKA
jgi:hypothetical protein